MANPTGSHNKMEFSAEAIPLFVKALLTGLSMLIYVPAAGQLTGLLKYVTTNLRFADGTSANYVGTKDTVKQQLIGVTASIWGQILLGRMFSSPILNLIFTVAIGLVQAYFVFQLLKVVFPNIVTSHGSRLNFTATQGEYLTWQLVIVGATAIPALIQMMLPSSSLASAIISGLIGLAMAVVTLGLYGFAFTLYYRWFASKVQGGSRVPSFNAEPLTFILMMLGLFLFCCLIVTIPWAMLWFAKWQANQFSLPARVSIATA